MDKVLFLSFALPPLKYPQSIVISKIIKFMSIKPSVIYANEKNTIDTSIFENFDDYIAYKYQIPFNGGHRYISFFKRKFLPLFYQIPDIHRYWSNKLYKKSIKYINENDIKIIVTFGQPMSVHLAGLKLKKKNPKLKWIAHFSDPWVDNPLDDKGVIVKKINISLEKQVFEYADKLMFTSNETVSLVRKRYSKFIQKKMIYLPHSYDKSLYDYSLKNDSDTFIIRYIGGFYAQRSPEPLFKALSKIIEQDESILYGVKFEIVGDLGRHSHLIKKYPKILIYMTIVNNVAYKKSLELMSTSDILLLIDAPSENSIFFPSKLVDYIGSNKPIVGITPNGTSKNIIEKLGGITANPNNIDEIIQMLENILSNQSKYKKFIPNRNYHNYEASIVINEFMDIIDNV